MEKFTAQLWRTIDIVVNSTKEYRNPFEDVDVFGEFISENGTKLNILGFWDGDGKWVIRFAPTELGAWTYVITSTDESNADFSGEGTVEAIPYPGELAMYKHGFLRVSADRSHLEHADGTPFFWLGDTHWTFVTEERWDESNAPEAAVNADKVISNQMKTSQFRACVDKRVNQGFTVYQSNFRDGDVDGFFGRNLDFMQKTENGYLPNLDLFQNNVDKKMFYIAEQGLYHAVGYAWCFDMERMGKERYCKFAKYVAARYGALPVAWTLAGEVPGYMGDKEAVAAHWAEVARVGRKYSAYNNLMSAHLACDRPFPVLYTEEDWFDFAMSQAGHGDFDMSPEMYLDFVRDYKGFPVLESEATYEGATSNEYVSRVIGPDMMRRLAYLIIQCGGCGYTYGCNGVWELQWEAGVGGIGWGDMAWWDGLMLPGADQLTIMKNLYEEVNWSTLKPLGADRAETKSFFMNANPKTMIYFTGDEKMEIIVGYITQTSMRGFELKGLTAEEYEGFFMDPETGERTSMGRIIPNDGCFLYMPEQIFGNKKDSVFVIKKA